MNFRRLGDNYPPLPWWEGTKGRGKHASSGIFAIFYTPTLARLRWPCPPPSRGGIFGFVGRPLRDILIASDHRLVLSLINTKKTGDPSIDSGQAEFRI